MQLCNFIFMCHEEIFGFQPVNRNDTSHSLFFSFVTNILCLIRKNVNVKMSYFKCLLKNSDVQHLIKLSSLRRFFRHHTILCSSTMYFLSSFEERARLYSNSWYASTQTEAIKLVLYSFKQQTEILFPFFFQLEKIFLLLSDNQFKSLNFLF